MIDNLEKRSNIRIIYKNLYIRTTDFKEYQIIFCIDMYFIPL
jgi:hypothetical protein